MNEQEGTDKTASTKTVQEYIDENPVWSNGTPVKSIPLTSVQWRIWGLATAGKFFEGLVVFMTGVALPLMVAEFNLSAIEKGMVGAAPLFGILVGATALGGLADRFGRKPMFIFEMILFTVFLGFAALSPGPNLLVFFLFGIGLALGCDYPTAHMVISESLPSSSRGKLVLGAFGFQAVGALVGSVVGYVILREDPSLSAWRIMYATAIIPAVLVIIGRFFVPESAHWLMSRGKKDQAEGAVSRLLKRKPPYPEQVELAEAGSPKKQAEGKKMSGFGALFTGKNRRATILASIPWFLQDLGTYGIGIFTPTILAATVGQETEHPGSIASVIYNDKLAAEGAAFLDIFLILGILCAVLLTDRLGRIKLQVMGFIGCAAGLFLASLSLGAGGGSSMFLLFAGFILFNFMTNMGPNAQTYLISGEVFPTRIRGRGAGLAASFAKIGAVLTTFLFPVLIKGVGTLAVLYVLVGTSIAGAVITWIFRIETTGVNLEKIGEE